ncbi:hypothetical protein Lal_00016233 [Lupinus albus]|nr:hypothetical protein Lal_00016233 [Lupinus albus]
MLNSLSGLDTSRRPLEATLRRVDQMEVSPIFRVPTFPELQPAFLPNEPMADKPLKLLLPSLKFDFLDLLGFVGLDSTSSVSLLVLILARIN